MLTIIHILYFRYLFSSYGLNARKINQRRETQTTPGKTFNFQTGTGKTEQTMEKIQRNNNLRSFKKMWTNIWTLLSNSCKRKRCKLPTFIILIKQWDIVIKGVALNDKFI